MPTFLHGTHLLSAPSFLHDAQIPLGFVLVVVDVIAARTCALDSTEFFRVSLMNYVAVSSEDGRLKHCWKKLYSYLVVHLLTVLYLS